MVGSDTGIRTRVSAVRGRRPGPLDDIAIAANRRLGRRSHSFLFSHALQPFASKAPVIRSSNSFEVKMADSIVKFK